MHLVEGCQAGSVGVLLVRERGLVQARLIRYEQGPDIAVGLLTKGLEVPA